MKNFFKEFETFAMRGNAIDLSIGVLIGAAFNQITTALANNVLTPPLGLLVGDIDFSRLSIPLGAHAAIGYGLLIQALVNFVIVALALFLIVKLVNRVSSKKKQEEQKPSENLELKVLLEIRDELRSRQ